MTALDALSFDNSFSKLPTALHRSVAPTPIANPVLALVSDDCAALLNLDTTDSARWLQCFSGQKLASGMTPVAQKYTGHQFGVYNPELGDGRGLLLGEVINQHGERWDLHLKGAGQTPFSRMGDGRAVLRSSLREFFASEALHHLGVPTTRALCVLASDEPVMREQPETAATLLRVARSHIRFGHFEYLFHSQQHELLRQFSDYVLARHYPDCKNAPQPYAAMFASIVERTAQLMAHWQAIGFAHGVMNSDNFSICGDSFDFGPYAFLDGFDPALICNHSDWQGRYAFNRQVQIGLWNLNALALALSPLIEREILTATLQGYEEIFHTHYLYLLGSKLGLQQADDEDAELIGGLLSLMATDAADYTRTFRALADLDMVTGRSKARDEFRDRDSFDSWSGRYRDRLQRDAIAADRRQQQMLDVNPKYILRNYLAQQAISAAQQGDFSEAQRLHALLRKPFDEQPDQEHYAQLPPDWGKHLEISCSS